MKWLIVPALMTSSAFAADCFTRNEELVAKEVSLAKEVCIETVTVNASRTKAVIDYTLDGSSKSKEVSLNYPIDRRDGKVLFLVFDLDGSFDGGYCSDSVESSLSAELLMDKSGKNAVLENLSGSVSRTNDNCHMNMREIQKITYSMKPAEGTRVVSSKLSFNSDVASFTEGVNGGQTVKISYEVTALPLPKIDDSFMKIEKEMKCISWSYPGTSPDDPGVCGQYAETGKYRVFKNHAPIDLYSVKEVLTDLKSGKKVEKKLGNIKGTFYVDGGEVLVDRPEVPANLKFVSYVEGDTTFGCANAGIQTAPVLENLPVNVAVCTVIKGKASLAKTNGKYNLNVSSKLNFTTSVNAYWEVRDFPHTNTVRKDLWEESPVKNYVLE